MVGKTYEDKIKKLPAFLRGPAAIHFYATPAKEKATYDAATKKLKQALCPPLERENYYAKFDNRMLRNGEDPSVYKWELEQLLEKADPNLTVEAMQVCSFVLPIHAWSAKLYTWKTFASQPHANLKRDAEFCSTLSSDRRPRSPCTHERKYGYTQTDSGHRPTRGFNDRTSNSTESA